MKKNIVAIILSLCFAFGAFAQGPAGYGGRYGRYPRVGYRDRVPSYRTRIPVSFGTRIGLDYASVFSEAAALDGRSPEGNFLFGFSLGMPVSRLLDFESGLYYIGKGGRSGSGDARFMYDLDYLELPLEFRYNYFVSPYFAVRPLLGVYGAVGVGGRIRNYQSRDAFSSYSEGYFRRWDAGFRFGCGIAASIIRLDLVYDLGVANVGQDIFDKTRTGCLMLMFGFDF